MPYNNAHPAARRNLTTQACDICRRRKAKCSLDATNPNERCRRCQRLDLPCTFRLPSKVRGPKKGTATRHMNTIEESSDTGHGVTLRSQNPLNESRTWRFNSPIHRLSEAQHYPTDIVCNRELLMIIIEDFLELVYPVVPIVHIPSFRKSLKQDRDCADSGFLALLISLASLVVATMPSRFEFYRAYHKPLAFKSREDMVYHCFETLARVRTHNWFDEINFQKFSASYLIYVSLRQIGEHNQSRMVEVEMMQIARLLKFSATSDYHGLNCIEQELRKRGFWLVFYAFVHSQLQDSFGDRLAFLDPVALDTINLTDLLPLEVDDEMITADEVVMPTTPTPCIAMGFNLLSRVFWAALRDESPDQNLPCRCHRTRDINLQISHLKNRLHSLKFTLEHIPMIFRPWAHTAEGAVNDTASVHCTSSQIASMRVNIHATHLWLQSLLLDQLEAAQLQQAPVDLVLPTDNDFSLSQRRWVWSKREDICRQLFFLLNSSSPLSLEVNGLHLTYKVRDIAASFLACPFREDEPEAIRAAEYIQQFTSILSRLDRSERVNSLHLRTWTDTDRIRLTPVDGV